MFGSVVKVFRGIAKIRGATDNTLIGNVEDRMKTETVFAPDGLIIPTLGNNLIYEDMNTANGGINRNTSIGNSWVTVYQKSGLADGIFLGFLVTLEDILGDWEVRMIIDGSEVFGSSGISIADLHDDQVYGFSRSPADDIPEFLGFLIRKNTLRWEGPNDLPVRIDGDVGTIQILLRRASGLNKKFRAGLATRAVI